MQARAHNPNMPVPEGYEVNAVVAMTSTCPCTNVEGSHGFLKSVAAPLYHTPPSHVFNSTNHTYFCPEEHGTDLKLDKIIKVVTDEDPLPVTVEEDFSKLVQLLLLLLLRCQLGRVNYFYDTFTQPFHVIGGRH